MAAPTNPTALRRFGSILAAAAVVVGAQLALVLPTTPARGAVTCTFNSAPSVAFGNYSTKNASPTDSVGTINITCSAAPNGVAKFNAGSGTFAQRKMTSGANILNYNLYTTSARTQVWGDGTSGTGTVTFKATNNSLSVYGRIPAQQNAVPGVYGDTITVTISF